MRSKTYSAIKGLLPHKTNISNQLTLVRRTLRLCQDFIKLISISYQFIKPLLQAISFPISMINMGLQIGAVLYDERYPKKHKALMIAGLLFMILTAIAITVLAPSNLIALIGLTALTHYIRFHYRLSKLQLACQALEKKNQFIQVIDLDKKIFTQFLTLTQVLENNESALICKQAFNQLSESLTLKVMRTQSEKALKIKQQKKIINHVLGNILIFLRGLLSITLLIIAVTQPQLLIAFVLLSLFINLLDLARNIYTQQQFEKEQLQIQEQKEAILENCETELERGLKKSSYQKIWLIIGQQENKEAKSPHNKLSVEKNTFEILLQKRVTNGAREKTGERLESMKRAL